MIDVGCFRLLVSSCVSWANVDMIYLWRLSKFPGEGMFPAAAAEQENADRHEMKKMCEVPDWEGCRSVHDRAFNFCSTLNVIGVMSMRNAHVVQGCRHDASKSTALLGI